MYTSLTTIQECPRCEGDGSAINPETFDKWICPQCQGEGVIVVPVKEQDYYPYQAELRLLIPDNIKFSDDVLARVGAVWKDSETLPRLGDILLEFLIVKMEEEGIHVKSASVGRIPEDVVRTLNLNNNPNQLPLF